MSTRQQYARVELRALALMFAAYGVATSIVLLYVLSVFLIPPYSSTGVLRMQTVLGIDSVILGIGSGGYLVAGRLHLLLWSLSGAFGLASGPWILEHHLATTQEIPTLLLWMPLPAAIGLALVLILELDARFPAHN